MTDRRSTTSEDGKENAVSMPQVMTAVATLQAAADALAAVGARAAAGESGRIEPAITAGIDAVLAAADVPDLGGLEPPQRAMVAAYVRSAFAQALDLLDQPARPAGWSYTDPLVLEGQGRGSMTIPNLIAQSADFGAPESFLDVGTGVGWLAVGAAQLWPACEVVGVDTWEPGLERARRNVDESGLADRVELRNQSVADLVDRDRFDLSWAPIFFLAPETLAQAFRRILVATRPGGHIVVGRYDAPSDELAHATMRLRTIRDGGSWLDTDEVIELLDDAGWVDVRTLPKPGPITLGLVTGRKP